MTLTDPSSGIDLTALRALAAGTPPHPAASAGESQPEGLVPAVSYLRVSTKDQATRNGLDEGLSIPAQREAAQRKADQLGAVIVNEFIEPGESAKSARRRALQEMLDYIAAHPVRYCIINKVDRLARNRLDDAIIHATLRGANITLVSVTENIDETPSGMLMHGILASMAEFYSLNLAQEVVKGMVQKATIGGTPTKAPLGYRNARTTDAQGHEVREVELDPDRADLVRFAFTAYATGDWSLSSLARELKTRGLTTRPTPSQPAKPLTTTGLHKILTNPYYHGTVTFRGVTYDGGHTPLVDTETWLRVQTVLDSKNAVGERPQKYDHYLKGSLYCSCGAKLMIERPRDKQGDRYEYFTCAGRRRKTGCTRSAILAERIEDRIEREYSRNGLITGRLDNLATTYSSAQAGLDQITDILTDVGELYSKCEPAERRILNRALFKQIIVDEDEQVTLDPAEPAATVIAHSHSSETTEPGLDTKQPRHQTGQVSNFSTYVELVGLEPTASCLPSKRSSN